MFGLQRSKLCVITALTEILGIFLFQPFFMKVAIVLLIQGTVPLDMLLCCEKILSNVFLSLYIFKPSCGYLILKIAKCELSVQFRSASLSMTRRTLICAWPFELQQLRFCCLATFKCNTLCTTQHPTLKSVFENNQPVMVVLKLFSTCKALRVSVSISPGQGL